jgi:outer membrane protein OmpA-like peptidoglycan-associated protein
VNRDTGQGDLLARTAIQAANEQLTQALSVDAAVGLADLKRRIQQEPGKTRGRRLPGFRSNSSVARARGTGRRFLSPGLIAAAIAIIAAFAGSHIGLPWQGPANPPASPVIMSAPRGNPSALIVIDDSASSGPQAQLSALLAATAQPSERLTVLGPSGDFLYSGVAPDPPISRGPQPPAPLPHGASAYQQARYEHALTQYEADLKAAQETLRHEQQQELAAWTANAGAIVSVQRPHTDLVAALASAALELNSLDQALPDETSARVVVILGFGQQLRTAPTELPAGLKGTTVILNGFASSEDYKAAWQADMLEAGAARALSLISSGGNNQLATAIRIGLSSKSTENLTNISFAPDQTSFIKADASHLQQLATLLNSKYPHAMVTINGYADDLMTPQENLELSQKRAQAVSDWLVANGVASNRLKIIGHGDFDLIPPRSRDGQPLNRGVVVIVEPISGAVFDQP